MRQQASDPHRGIFRAAVFERQGIPAVGVPVDLRLPSLPLVTSVALGLCLLLALFAVGAEYTRHERVTGMASTGLGAMKVYAGSAGVVVKRFVNEGDAVREGQPLFQISTDRSTTQQLHAAQATIEVLRQRQQALHSDLAVRQQLYEATVDKLNAQVRSGISQQGLLVNEVALARQRSKNAAALLERYRQLVSQGFASEATLIEKEQDAASLAGQVESLERQREALARDIESLTKQVAEARYQRDLDLSAIHRTVNEIEQQLLDSDARKETLVTAEVAGRVTGVVADKGQVVAANALLLSLLPEGDIQDVQLYVPSRAIGFIRQGLPVMLRFDAFPYQKFGQYPGVISTVSLSPLNRADIQFNLPAGEDYYRVWVRPDKPWVLAYGQQIKLQNGMQVEADVLVDRRRLYEWVLEPLLGFVART